MMFLRKRKKERVNEIKEKDSGELSQAMIIISGLAVAGITVTGTIAGASLTKGEESARCINNFNTFESGATSNDCSTVASNGDGTLPPGGNENVTPGEPIEKNPTSEDCFEVKAVSGGTSIAKYLIAEKPEECGKFVIIPDELDGAPVVNIGTSAFNPFYYVGSGINEEHKINSVVIPSTVKTIGSSAFHNNLLTSVNIPDSVTEVGHSAFKNNKLSSVKLSSSLEGLGRDSFSYNEITSVDIPDSVKRIEYGAFESNNIVSVNIPNSVNYIGDRSFNGNKLTSVNIPDSVEYIGASSFADNKLTHVKIPDSVTTMGDGAFRSNKLTSVDISNSLTSIGGSVFYGNQLTSVTVPKSVENIGGNAFHQNPNLQELKVATGTKVSNFATPAGTKITYY